MPSCISFLFAWPYLHRMRSFMTHCLQLHAFQLWCFSSLNLCRWKNLDPSHTSLVGTLLTLHSSGYLLRCRLSPEDKRMITDSLFLSLKCCWLSWLSWSSCSSLESLKTMVSWYKWFLHVFRISFHSWWLIGLSWLSSPSAMSRWTWKSMQM